MLILAATTDKIQVVTSAAVTVDVHASFADLASGTVTPGRSLTAITTATTTDIVAAPGASTFRNVKSLTIRNKHATSSVDVTVVYDANGTDYELHKATLFAGEVLEWIEGVGFFVVASNRDHPFFFKGVLGSDVSTAADTNPVDVTGLVFSFEASATYWIDLAAVLQAPAATTGYGLQLNTSVAVTLVTLQFFHQLANTGTLSGGSSIADDASVGVSSGFPTNATNVPAYGGGLLVAAGSAGTAQLRLRSETTAVATIKANSSMRVMKLAG